MTTRRSRKFYDTPQSDEELMAQFCTTHEARFLEQLVCRYEYDLYHYLKRFLGDSQLAEDVFQATFLQIYLKSAQFDVARKFRPWLYMVATNQAIDTQRRNKRHRGVSLEKNINTAGTELEGISLLEILPSEEVSPEAKVLKDERAEQIRGLINELSEPLRQVIILIYYEGIKYREVAEILNIPVGTVKSRLHTAMKKLGLLIRGIGDE